MRFELSGRGAAVAAALVVLPLAGCVAVAWPATARLVPRFGGHPTGDSAWSWAFLGLLIVAFVAYAWAALAAARGRLPLRLALIVAVAVQAVPLGAPLLLSTDAWTYWDYGRLAAVHGANPYVVHPAAFPFDPAFVHMGTQWHDTTSVYGPLFTLVSEPLALAAGSSPTAAAWIYKVLAALGILTAALLAARVSRRPALALVVVGWSPLLALHAAGAGHNDAWVAGLLLGALAAGAARRPVLAGAGWAAAALVKWVPLVLLALRLVGPRRAGRGDPARYAAGFLALTAVVAAAASWRYGWHWLGALAPLIDNSDDPTSFSVPGRLQQLGLPHVAAVALPLGALGVAAVWLLLQARAGRPRLGLASLLLVACSPLLAPWYLLWALPLAAADDDGPALVAGVALSAYVLAQTIPF